MSETVQDKEKAPLKIKKPKKLTNTVNEDYKVNLTKKPVEETTKVEIKNAIQEQKPDDSNVIVEKQEDKTSGEKLVEEVRPTEEKEVVSPIVEVERKEKALDLEKPVTEDKP